MHKFAKKRRAEPSSRSSSSAAATGAAAAPAVGHAQFKPKPKPKPRRCLLEHRCLAHRPPPRNGGASALPRGPGGLRLRHVPGTRAGTSFGELVLGEERLGLLACKRHGQHEER